MCRREPLHRRYPVVTPISIIVLVFILSRLVLHEFATNAEKLVVIASTTSTENSGLTEHLLPLFTARKGIETRLIAVGTGQAIRLGERGDADLLIVHDPTSEESFVAEGYGLERITIMRNDFVIVGPRDDPAKVRGRDAIAALRDIAAKTAPFMSRGDESGTHHRERLLWTKTGTNEPDPGGNWYRETGSGMGATLNVTAERNAYTLTDRATWLAFANKRDLDILVEGDQRLENPYSLIAIDPYRHSHVRAANAQSFIQWITSEEGRQAIESFEIGGEHPFQLVDDGGRMSDDG